MAPPLLLPVWRLPCYATLGKGRKLERIFENMDLEERPLENAGFRIFENRSGQEATHRLFAVAPLGCDAH